MQMIFKVLKVGNEAGFVFFFDKCQNTATGGKWCRTAKRLPAQENVNCSFKNRNMQQPKVLVIGRHSGMLARVLSMLTAAGYEARGTQDNAEAFALLRTWPVDAVIIGGGVDDESRHLFHNQFPVLQPGIKIIDAHPQTVLADLAKTLGKA
jgi:hypothetical protein